MLRILLNSHILKFNGYDISPISSRKSFANCQKPYVPSSIFLVQVRIGNFTGSEFHHLNHHRYSITECQFVQQGNLFLSKSSFFEIINNRIQ